MELCTARGISNLLLRRPSLLLPLHFASNRVRTIFQCETRFPVFLKQISFNYELSHHVITCLSSTTDASTYDSTVAEETTPEVTMTEETTPEATALEQIQTEATTCIKDEPNLDSPISAEVEESLIVEKKDEYINKPNEVSQDSSFGDSPQQLLKILEDLNIKFDFEEKYSYLVLGSGALIALWISAAVVGAVDSIPLLPKVLELIGLGYAVWFSTRFLIFKQNREELGNIVEQFKRQVLGSQDD